MTVAEYIERLKNSPEFMKNVTCWRVLPERAAKYGEFPATLEPGVVAALKKRGIDRPYIHQARAIGCALEGRDLVVVTPTASGKTLCYNVPVLDAILKDESARALYIFPTKALSSDQAAELYSMIEAIDCPIKAYTYDGGFFCEDFLFFRLFSKFTFKNNKITRAHANTSKNKIRKSFIFI